MQGTFLVKSVQSQIMQLYFFNTATISVFTSLDEVITKGYNKLCS